MEKTFFTTICSSSSSSRKQRLGNFQIFLVLFLFVCFWYWFVIGVAIMLMVLIRTKRSWTMSKARHDLKKKRNLLQLNINSLSLLYLFDAFRETSYSWREFLTFLLCTCVYALIFHTTLWRYGVRTFDLKTLTFIHHSSFQTDSSEFF